VSAAGSELVNKAWYPKQRLKGGNGRWCSREEREGGVRTGLFSSQKVMSSSTTTQVPWQLQHLSFELFVYLFIYLFLFFFFIIIFVSRNKIFLKIQYFLS
jgi:hypothetical protein